MARGEVVGRPLPDVAGHVVEPVAVRGESPHRRGTHIAVGLEVLPRELALPRVRHHPPERGELVAPAEHGLIEPAAGRVLPLRLGRQLLAGPLRVRLGIDRRDVHDGVELATADVAVGSLRPPPERPGRPRPPVAGVAQVDGTGARLEHQRARHEQRRIGVRIVLWIGRALGPGHVARVPREPPKGRDGHGVLVDPEAIELDQVDRFLLRIEALRSHPKAPGRDPPHSFAPGIARRRHCPIKREPRGRFCRCERTGSM